VAGEIGMNFGVGGSGIAYKTDLPLSQFSAEWRWGETLGAAATVSIPRRPCPNSPILVVHICAGSFGVAVGTGGDVFPPKGFA